MLESQIPFIVWGCGGGGAGNQLPTFDAESKNSKMVGRGGGRVNFQLLILSPNLLKSKKKFTRGFAEIFGQKSACGEFWVLTTNANHKKNYLLISKTYLSCIDLKH